MRRSYVILCLVVTVAVLAESRAHADTVTVPAGQTRNIGHGIVIDNTNGSTDAVIGVNADSYQDPVSGDWIWILQIDSVSGDVLIVDNNDTYNGPPGFQNDTAVWLNDGRNPPDSLYTGPGKLHGNGDGETTLADGTLKGLNRVNGTPVQGCTPN